MLIPLSQWKNRQVPVPIWLLQDPRRVIYRWYDARISWPWVYVTDWRATVPVCAALRKGRAARDNHCAKVRKYLIISCWKYFCIVITINEIREVRSFFSIIIRLEEILSRSIRKCEVSVLHIKSLTVDHRQGERDRRKISNWNKQNYENSHILRVAPETRKYVLACG